MLTCSSSSPSASSRVSGSLKSFVSGNKMTSNPDMKEVNPKIAMGKVGEMIKSENNEKNHHVRLLLMIWVTQRSYKWCCHAPNPGKYWRWSNSDRSHHGWKELSGVDVQNGVASCETKLSCHGQGQDGPVHPKLLLWHQDGRYQNSSTQSHQSYVWHLPTGLVDDQGAQDVGWQFQASIDEKVETIGSSEVARVESESIVDKGVGKPVEIEDAGSNG